MGHEQGELLEWAESSLNVWMISVSHPAFPTCVFVIKLTVIDTSKGFNNFCSATNDCQEIPAHPRSQTDPII